MNEEYPDSNKFLSAMLQLKKTPVSDSQVSPAEIIYGRQLQNSFAFLNKLEFFFFCCATFNEKSIGTKRTGTAFKTY